MNNLIKKWYLLILVCLMCLLVGCNRGINPIKFDETDNFKSLNEVAKLDNEYKQYFSLNDKITYDQFNYLNDFANSTVKNIFDDNENYIYSPISLYMALGMLANGASGNTLETLLTLLKGNSDKTLEQINNDMNLIYNHNYYDNDEGLAQMANSIWIKNNFPVKDNYINRLTESYYANCYHTDFKDEAKENIAKWINCYTRDLLKLTKKDITCDEYTALMLINTIYFDNKWANEFKKENNYYDKFFGTVKTEEVEYMKHTITSTYYETEKYEVFYDYFYNNNKIKFILPKGDYTISDCLNENVISNDIALRQRIELSLSIPKFETKSRLNLNTTLKDLGVGEMFTEDANFLNISDIETFVSSVIQDAAIELTEEGVKAAAATTIVVTTESVGPELIFKRIVLNRPFIYLILDEYDVPLFVGVINNL